jgi:hypothetical protein
VRRNEVL